MSVLWEQLAQLNHAPPETAPLAISEEGRPSNGFAVLVPVNARTDPAVRRNTDLVKERFEGSMGFSLVVEAAGASSTATHPTETGADDENGGVPVTNALLHAMDAVAESVRTNTRDIVLVYLCSSTAIDPNVIVSALQRYPQFLSRVMILFDAPALSRFSSHAVSPASERATVILPPILMPRDTFEGHMSLKLLHAMLDLGDGGRLPSLANIAALINDVAHLANGQSHIATVSWCSSPLTSNAKATFIACVSQAIVRDSQTSEVIQPDGRTVGSNLKRIVSSSKVRLVLEKTQSFVIALPSERSIGLTVDDAHTSFDSACADLSINTPEVSFVTYDSRVHARVPQAEFGFLAECMLNHSLTLIDPTVPSTTAAPAKLRWQHFGTTFKYEVVASYREFLLLDALARLHTPSSQENLGRSIQLEELGVPVVTLPANQPVAGQARSISAQPLREESKHQQPSQHDQHQHHHQPVPRTESSRSAPSQQQQQLAPQQQQQQQQPGDHQQPVASQQQSQQQQQAPAPAPMPQQQQTPAAPSMTLAEIELLVERRVAGAVAAEREARERAVRESREDAERRLKEAQSDFDTQLRQERDARARMHEEFKKELAEVRGSAASHVAVERALADMQATVRASSSDSATADARLKQVCAEATVDLRQHAQDSDREVRALRDEVAAIASATQLHEDAQHQARGQLVGVEHRYEALVKEFREIRDSSIAATALTGTQLPEVLDAARELAGRVKVVEVAIDRLYNGATQDLTVHGRRMDAIERSLEDVRGQAMDIVRRGAASPNGSPYVTAHEAEAIASNAANTAAARVHDAAVIRIDRCEQQQQQQRASSSSTGENGVQQRLDTLDRDVRACQHKIDQEKADRERAVTDVVTRVASMPQPAPTNVASTSGAEFELLQRSVNKNTSDAKELRQRVQKLELSFASVESLLENEPKREEQIHGLDIRVDALSQQMQTAQQTLKRTQSSLQ